MPKVYYVYILARGRNGTLYIGVTNEIARRSWEHRGGFARGFTKRHGVKILVHCETFEDIRLAIQREKRFKKWKRRWKLELIEKHNPGWCDLYEMLNA